MPMCIIARVPEGTKVPTSYIENMWNRNSHGAGIGYIDENNKVQIEKAMKLKEYKKLYKEISSEYSNRDMLLHFRIATLGSVCLENTHPFRVNKNTIMAHNGMLPEFFEPTGKAKKLDLSDTRYFVDYFMKYVDIKSLDDPAFIMQLGRIIDSENYANKLVFLTSDTRLKFDSYIVGEQHGEYDKKTGIWFSNSSYCKVNFFGYTKRNSWDDYSPTVTTTYNWNSGSVKSTTMEEEMDDVNVTKYLSDIDVDDDYWAEYGLINQALVKEYGQAIPSKNSEYKWECIYCGGAVEGDLRQCETDCEGMTLWWNWVDEYTTTMYEAEADYKAAEEIDLTKLEAEKIQQLKLGDSRNNS